MVEMRQRIDRGDYEQEVQEAIQVSIDFLNCVGGEMSQTNQDRGQAMCDIAKDRAGKLEVEQAKI